MRRTISIIFIVGGIGIFLSSCNIVPKQVQYQKEEERLLGNVDIINPKVEEIQGVLDALGYDTGNTDGRMGQKTRQAIREFQESIGVKSTGYIDKTTLTQIEDILHSIEERELKNRYTVNVKSAYPVRERKTAEFTPTTKDIQRALKNAGFNPGPVDGKMGPRTRQAIKEFQRTKGLTPDGVVGPKTWSELSKYFRE